MNVFRGFIPRLSSTNVISQSIRTFTISSSILAPKQKYDRFYKITKQVYKVDKTVYEAGQDRPKHITVPRKMPAFPKYDYEVRFFKRQNRGLYGGLQRKRSKSSSEYMNKSLRAHTPNVQRATLWSEILNKKLKLRVATKVLRTISREGGLDKYLLKSTPARIKTMGLMGWKLRYKLLKELEQQERGVVELSNGAKKDVLYIDPVNGAKFYAPKEKILAELYDAVQRDSYYPIKPIQFEKRYSWWSYEDIVNKLKEYNRDLSKFAL
ncbi:MRPL24 54S ribosomal protein L24 [Candida maltosa Xu316]